MGITMSKALQCTTHIALDAFDATPQTLYILHTNSPPANGLRAAAVHHSKGPQPLDKTAISTAYANLSIFSYLIDLNLVASLTAKVKADNYGSRLNQSWRLVPPPPYLERYVWTACQ